MGREPELVTWPPVATFPDAPRARISRCRVARQLPFLNRRRRSRHADHRIGYAPHIHRAVAWDDGKLERLRRVDMRHHLLEGFAKKLTKEDVVLVEAKGDRRGEDLKVIEQIGRA